MPNPLWINATAGAPEYDARHLRRSQAMWLYPYDEVGDAGRLDARPGLRPSGTDPVSLSGATITVHPLAATVAPRLTEDQGSYVVQHTGTTHTLDPVDLSNPRIDIVVLRVYDDDEDASGHREAVTEYIAGDPAAAPIAPTVPPGALELAVIDVPASGSGSATVTTTAPYSVASGGILPVRDATEYPTGGRYLGMPLWDQSAEQLKVRVSGDWAIVGQRWDRGFVTEDTDIIYGHGGASRSTQRRYWTRLTDKLVWCNWYVSFSSNGVGDNDLQLGAPTDIDRTSRQVVFGHLETGGAPVARNLHAVAFTGGSGNRFDRIRWEAKPDDDTVDPFPDVNGMFTMKGRHVTSSMLAIFQGIYREA